MHIKMTQDERMDTMKINEKVSVGGQPSDVDLQELARQGYKSVINLRTEGEEEQPMSPAEEAEKVGALGLKYRHIPVDMKAAGPETVNRFRQELPGLPGPIFVHCHTGKRAGAFTMMDQAVQNGMTGTQTLEQAEKMGFKCDSPELKKFVTEYVDSKLGGA